MINGRRWKWIALGGIVVMAVLFFGLDLDRFVSLTYLQNSLTDLQEGCDRHPILSKVAYMGIYILVAALSLPGAAALTLAGGALFGLGSGTLLVSFASTLGATLAFLISRYLFRDWVRKQFGHQLTAINAGIRKEGGFYLFALRLVPVFPFFLINLAMGVTPVRTGVFYLISQIGMLPATLVYVNAGTRLAEVNSLSGILSPGLMVSFALLGLFPLAAGRLVAMLRERKVYAGYEKPGRFDYNLVVIGAGSAGLVASYIAAAVRAGVALIEAEKMGGDCLNTGCVPSKALIATTRLLAGIRRAREFGLDKASAEVDFPKVMDRVHTIIRQIAPHDSTERYEDLGVDCIQGRAVIVSPFKVKVGERVLTTRNIIVATGARPLIPDLPGLETVPYLTSETLWNLRTLPRTLAVLGGGPVGCELAQCFARLGSQVTLIQRNTRLLPREDPDVSDTVLERFRQEGVTVLLDHSARAVETSKSVGNLVLDHGGREVTVAFDELLLALGRVPNVRGLGLEDLGIELGRNQAIETNPFLQTRFPNIFCAGDVHGRYQFTHTAAHESWYATVNALFGRFKKFPVDYRTIPWATYVDPEVARVGLNETDAARAGIACDVVKYGLEDLDRAVTDSEAYGFVKVLTVPKKDRILGVTIVGHHAADMMAEFVLAMKHGIGLNKILGTIHIYPTMAEANKYAAGVWKRTHAPEKLLAWIEAYHARQRH